MFKTVCMAITKHHFTAAVAVQARFPAVGTSPGRFTNRFDGAVCVSPVGGSSKVSVPVYIGVSEYS